MTKDLRGRVDPLPQVKPYEPLPYNAERPARPVQAAHRGRQPAARGGGGSSRRT